MSVLDGDTELTPEERRWVEADRPLPSGEVSVRTELGKGLWLKPVGQPEFLLSVADTMALLAYVGVEFQE